MPSFVLEPPILNTLWSYCALALGFWLLNKLGRSRFSLSTFLQMASQFFRTEMRSALSLSVALLFLGFASAKDKKKCGLPVNYSVLPDFAQEELRAVWKNYVPGNPCEQELLITDDIMAVLEMFEKEDGKGSSNEKGTMGASKSSIDDKGEDSDADSNRSPDLEASSEISPESIPKTIVYPTLSPVNPAVNSQKTGRRRTTTESPDDYDDGVATTTTYFPPRRTTTAAKTTIEEEYEDYEEKTTTTTRRPRTKQKKHKTKRPASEAVEDQNIAEGNFQDIQSAQQTTDVEKLPFLKRASSDVVDEFLKVLQDNDIPSEERRQEQLHLLAVSLLNSKQLQLYNAWSTSQRKRLREQENRTRLSRDAHDALKSLSALDAMKQHDFVRALPKDVRQELRQFSLKQQKA
ncbi:hypothetical protein L596_003589 [Steinernema carpocapsae]|uniref:Uncharacterized protein n=1 Tax=Steinernema carpocapsae TaxID=34508 RepID=A0A4U8UT63_STECR|nr:hypothetical protein L596_003589 [Steinernema carpocapsae]